MRENRRTAPANSGPEKVPAEQVVKDIRRATRRQFSAEEKIRIVELTRFRGLFTAMAGQVSSWCSLSYSMGDR